jgi:hypothetical protein
MSCQHIATPDGFRTHAARSCSETSTRASSRIHHSHSSAPVVLIHHPPQFSLCRQRTTGLSCSGMKLVRVENLKPYSPTSVVGKQSLRWNHFPRSRMGAPTSEQTHRKSSYLSAWLPENCISVGVAILQLDPRRNHFQKGETGGATPGAQGSGHARRRNRRRTAGKAGGRLTHATCAGVR